MSNELEIPLKSIFSEGGKKLLIHFVKERNKSLIREAKKQWLKTSRGKGICCEICNFNFGVAYGKLGYGFIEAHHNKPISELTEKTKMKIIDLSPLCANCHRMIHRKRIKPLSIEDLKKVWNMN